MNHFALSFFARVFKKGHEAFEYDADDLMTFLKRENKNLGNIKPQEQKNLSPRTKENPNKSFNLVS